MKLFKATGVRQFLSLAVMGGVIAAIDIPIIISLAIFIYSGEMAQYASAGIGAVLFGAFVANLIMSQMSTVRGTVAGPQDSPSAILALMVATVVSGMGAASAEVRFATVFTLIALTTIIAGFFFILVGKFNLSRFVRFIPYPVVGGFIAGTGLLLTQGAMTVLTDLTPGIGNLGAFFQANNLSHWLPGAVFGILLLVVSRRYQKIWVVPLLLTLAAGIFYGYVFATGQSLDFLRTDGILLGPFSQDVLWNPVSLSILAQVDWTLILGQATNLAAILVISAIAVLLNASALELIAREDMRLNDELVATGVTNMIAGIGGSPVSYHYLSLAALPMRMGINSRLIGVIAGLGNLAVLIFGATLLELIPKFIVGGLLLFLGLSFLVEWVYDAWKTLPRSDYILVLIILAIVGGVGFLEGVGAGILIAVVLFAITYSRVDFIKDTLTGFTFQSNVERPPEHSHIIQEEGSSIHILRLQGFLFFGTAQSLLSRIRERFNDASLPKLRYLILDFHRVSALDSSVAISFVRLKQLAETNDFFVLFTDLKPQIHKKLEQNGLLDETNKFIKVFPSLDYGMEWCENRIITSDSRSLVTRAATLKGQLRQVFTNDQAIQQLMTYLERQEIEAGQVLMKQGDLPEDMYLVDSGEVTAHLEVAPDEFIRLRSVGGGTVMGEIGLYIKTVRTASVIATQPSVVYRLSYEALQRMEKQDPDIAALLHHWIARTLSERLASNSRTLEALLK